MTINYINPPNYWTSNHILGASEIPDTGDISLYDVAIQASTGEQSICLNATPGSLVWSRNITVLYEGIVTLVAGTANVSLAAFASGQKVNLSYITPGGTAGAIFVSAINPGTGFTITSTNVLDTSIIGWTIYT